MFYQHNINGNTRLAVWKIEEDENFFLPSVPLQREITHPHKRLQHLAGRYLLRFLFPDFPYGEIVIADTRKPYLPYEQYHFSVSHCGNFAAAIVSENERVGIDIEIPSAKIDRISKKFLNRDEFDFISKTTKQQNSKATVNSQQSTIIWSSKETVFKWWSYGNVDFREHILLKPFLFDKSGLIKADFIRSEEIFSLQLQYKLFDELCLVWLNSAE